MPSLMLMVASDAEFHTEHMTELQLKAEVNLNKLCAWRQYAPAPLLPQWAPKRLTPRSRPQHSSTFPQSIRSHADRYSYLTP